MLARGVFGAAARCTQAVMASSRAAPAVVAANHQFCARSLSSSPNTGSGDSAASSSVWQRVAGAAVAGAAALGVALGISSSTAACHGPSDNARIDRLEKQVDSLIKQLNAQHDVKQTSGQGDAVFAWDQELTSAFPAAAKPFEKDMHGGFNEDVNTGIVYTGIPGYGLCAISPDLKTWTKVGSDKRLEANIHGLVVFQHKGETLIAAAQHQDQRVLIVDLKGKVRQELHKPRGGEFTFDEANGYYGKRRHKTERVFFCTDVTFLNGKLYVTTGYCEGDFVLTAQEVDGKWQWGPVAWGGRGEGPGKFKTAHGVFAHDNHIYVANREAFEIVKFTPEGKLVEILPDIPDESRICNVAFAEHHKYFVFNALAPLPHTAPKTAPIYAHTGDKLLSTIDPGELGIPVLKHLHHVWPHYVMQKDGSRQLYLLVHGWRDGKFAVLRHVPQ